MDILYKRIKEGRERLRLSQEEVAKKLGYKSRSTIARIEAGEIDLTQSKIIDFARVLNSTPSYLMGWDDEDKSIKKVPTPREGAEALRILLIQKLGREPTDAEMQMSDNVLNGLWKSLKK